MCPSAISVEADTCLAQQGGVEPMRSARQGGVPIRALAIITPILITCLVEELATSGLITKLS